jgi:hypothetical protein
MKALFLEIFLILAIVPMAIPKPCVATEFINTPGDPMKVVVATVGGYNFYEMGGGGNTLVQRKDAYMTLVRHGGKAPTFIQSGPDIPIQPVFTLSPDLGIALTRYESHGHPA